MTTQTFALPDCPQWCTAEHIGDEIDARHSTPVGSIGSGGNRLDLALASQRYIEHRRITDEPAHLDLLEPGGQFPLLTLTSGRVPASSPTRSPPRRGGSTSCMRITGDRNHPTSFDKAQMGTVPAARRHVQKPPGRP